MAESSPPPGIDLSADQGGRIIASMIALIALPTLAVAARLISRLVARAGFWYDDLWVVIALLLSYGPIICVLVSQITNGFGKHIWTLQESNAIQFMRILYIYEVFYFASCFAIKICILRPLVALITRGTHRAPKKGGANAQGTNSSGSSRIVWRRRDSSQSKAGQFSRLDDPTPPWGRHVIIKGGRDTEHGSDEDISLQEINVPPGQIKVKEEIVVTSTDWLEYKDRVY
ncbi:MAG: hypothetical protein Q9200_003099 [Gallowayella weberi]